MDTVLGPRGPTVGPTQACYLAALSDSLWLSCFKFMFLLNVFLVFTVKIFERCFMNKSL